jgi:hypothetical protein
MGKWSKVGGGVVLVASLLFGKNILIGTGSVGGGYYTVGNVLCHIYTNYSSTGKMNQCLVVPTNGSKENLEKVKEGIYDFAIVQSDILAKELEREKRLNLPPNQRVKIVAALYPEVMTLVVNKKSRIFSFKEIQGKKICIPSSGTCKAVKELMNFLRKIPGYRGLSFRYDVGECRCFSSRMPDSFDKVDGFFYVIGHPVALIEGIKRKIRFIPIPERAINYFSRKKGYEKAVIPAGIYVRGNGKTPPVPAQNIPTYGTRAVIITRADMPAQRVKDLLTTLLDHFAEFRKSTPLLMGIKSPYEMHYIRLGIDAIHPGAEAAFNELSKPKECGIACKDLGSGVAPLPPATSAPLPQTLPPVNKPVTK